MWNASQRVRYVRSTPRVYLNPLPSHDLRSVYCSVYHPSRSFTIQDASKPPICFASGSDHTGAGDCDRVLVVFSDRSRDLHRIYYILCDSRWHRPKPFVFYFSSLNYTWSYEYIFKKFHNCYAPNHKEQFFEFDIDIGNDFDIDP